MIVQSKSPQFSRHFVNSISNAMDATPGGRLFDNAVRVKLMKAPVSLGPDIDIAALLAVEADFTGYAAGTASADAHPVGVGANTIGNTYIVDNFRPTNPTTVPNTIYGYWADDGGGPPTDWLVAELFDQPLTLQSAADFIQLFLILGFTLNPMLF